MCARFYWAAAIRTAPFRLKTLPPPPPEGGGTAIYAIAYGEVDGKGVWVAGGAGGRLAYLIDEDGASAHLRNENIGGEDMGQVANKRYVLRMVDRYAGTNFEASCDARGDTDMMQAANCEYLLKMIDKANRNTTTYGTSSYATKQAVDTIAVDDAVNRLWKPSVKFVATGRSGKMAYSDDGVSWTAVADSTFGTATIITIIYSNGVFVAASTNGEMAYSVDGINWMKITNLPVEKFNEFTLIYGSGKFVAISGKGDFMYSTDSITWTKAPEFSSAESYPVKQIAYGNGKFVGSYIFSGNMIYSTDGITWTKKDKSDIDQSDAIVYGNGKFVAVGFKSSADAAAYSTDGINWTKTTIPEKTKYAMMTLAYGNGKFLAGSSYKKRMAYSTDGINWTATTNPFGNTTINRLLYVHDKFFAFRDEKMMYSTDGINWTATTNPLGDSETYAIAYKN